MAIQQEVRFPLAPLYRTIRPVLIAIAVVVVVIVAAQLFVGLYTSSAWFSSLGEHDVFTRRLRTQLVLLLVVGGVSALALVGSALLAYRFCIPAMQPARGTWASRYRRYGHRRRNYLIALAGVLTFLSAGLGAMSNWQQVLLWRNATSFGQKDAQFHRDVSYYVFVYPLHRYVVTTAMSAVVIALVTTLVVAVLCGVLRLRDRRPLPRLLVAQLSALLGLLYVVKAGAYWLDRLGLVTSSRGLVTGPSYTDIHATSPAKLILVVLALIAAAALFANSVVRRHRIVLFGVGGMFLAGIIIGGVYPSLVQRFNAKPNGQSVEQTSIRRNIAATRTAFGLADVQPQPLTPTGASPAQLRQIATSALQARVLDPNRVPLTFTQLQQERSVYGFKSTLDVDHYPIDGRDQDLVIATRELTLGSLPSAQQTWGNKHLVYTHGYGIVAAPLDSVSAEGEPDFVESGLPPTGSLGSFEPRIYFGQSSPAYSVVGGPGSNNNGGRELDLPAVQGTGSQVRTSYAGKGGVPIGSWFRQLVYAIKFRDANLFLSSEVGSGSKLLYIRDPRRRVSTVAPWLTLDGDAYPVVADGRVLWVVDGYTTSNNYPMSQQENFRSATVNTFTTNGSSVAQSGSINYIRNSVKATVDAYDGTVTLYAWNQAAQPDPILRAWESAFPGLVKPQSAIPTDLLPHLRYPQDLFNMQRQVLTNYHVVDSHAFYDGSDFWKVPTDPTMSNSPLQPSYYTSVPVGDTTTSQYALTTSFTTLNRRSLAAYLSVDAAPGPGYGTLSLLEIPAAANEQGPGQIQNDIESDPVVAQQLTLLRGGGSQVVLGNLQSVPLGGQMLYVEPIYERAAGGTSFPILRRVIVVYHRTIAYDKSLAAALRRAIH